MALEYGTVNMGAEKPPTPEPGGPRYSLLTDKARRIFSWSAWVVVGLGIFFAFMLTPWYQGLGAVPQVLLAVKWVGGTLGVVSLLAVLVLLVGMAIFCAKEDRSPFSVKLSWFILFFMIAPFGSAIYYFVVYRKLVDAAPSDTA